MVVTGAPRKRLVGNRHVGSNPTLSAIHFMTPLESVVRCDPDVLGGTPVFAGTRVPVKICWTTSPPVTA